MAKFYANQPVTLTIYRAGPATLESRTVSSVKQGVVQLRGSTKMFDARTGELLDGGGSTGAVSRIDPAR